MIAGPLAFLFGAILAWGTNALELIPWRKSAGAHWTERARRLYPARLSRNLNLWTIPAARTLLGRHLIPAAPWGLVLAAALLGTLLGNYPMDRDTHYDLAFRPWAHQVAANLLLQFSTLGAYLAAALLMPDRFDWRVAAIGGALLGAVLALQFGLTVRLMRALRLLRPASPRLQRLVDETSAGLGLKPRAAWEMARCDANAVAFVTTNELAFTDGLLVFCPDDELKAICAHELGHLSESRLTLAGRLAGALILFPLVFFRPVLGTVGSTGLLGLAAGVLLIWFLVPRLARAMERRADRIAHASTADPTLYARALEHLYRVNHMPAVIGKKARQSHPDLYDRMLAAGVTPDYPRPKTPDHQGWTSVVITVAAAMTAILLIQ